MPDSTHGSVTHQIDRARAGDAAAKVWLWERYRRLLYAMAHDGSDDDRWSGAVDTSDVVAEAGDRLFAADLRDIQDRKHFQNWLRQVVRSEKIDLQRREAVRRTDPLADDSGLAPAGPDVPDFIPSDMQDLLNALPLTLHETALALMEHGNERDTADALRISRHEIRNRMDAIRDIWSKALGKE